MKRSAELSEDRVFRFTLTRQWGAKSEPAIWVVFCGLNPSTADAEVDDPTIRRDVGFAKSFGANSLLKVNIIPYRATDPKTLKAACSVFRADPIRRMNALVLRNAAKKARSGLGKGVFAAWGNVPRFLSPEIYAAMDALGAPLLCLGVTKSGAPRHPLYLPKTACPMGWPQ